MQNSQDTCQLLGPVSILIQLFMGAVAVVGLLIKRNHEHPRRKMIVWVYDVGKQISGALSIHFVNLGLSVLKKRRKQEFHASYPSDNEEDDGQCDWYFLNLLLDTTVGIPILWVCLSLIENILSYFRVKNIESGNYFPKTKDETITGEKTPMFSAFFKQLLVFTSGLAIMKVCVFVILNYFEDAAYLLADLILGWSDAWPNFQIVLVMFVCPVVLNCFQYFCVDNIIKLPTNSVNLDNVDNFETEPYDGNIRSAIITGVWNSDVPSRGATIKPWDGNAQYGSII